MQNRRKVRGSEQKAPFLFPVMLTVGKIKYPIQKQVLQYWEAILSEKVDDPFPETTKNEQVSYWKTPAYTVLVSYCEHCPQRVKDDLFAEMIGK